MSNCGCGNISLPNGADGIDGKNAFTITAAAFTQPAIGAQVTIPVSDAGQYTGIWAAVPQIIFIENGGYYEVFSSSSATVITVTNLGYLGNTIAGALIPLGQEVSPAGLRGVAGTNGTDGVAVVAIDGVASAAINSAGFTAVQTEVLPNFTQVDDAVEIEFVLMTSIAVAGRLAYFRVVLNDGVNPAIVVTKGVEENITQFAGVKYRLVVARSSPTRVTPYRERLNGSSGNYATGEFLSVGAGSYETLPISGVINFAVPATLTLELKTTNAADFVKNFYWKVTRLKK
tara:strand:- start:4055 stop:4915 length:861 start_codon:yes stop_codon:yes gene_type:complete